MAEARILFPQFRDEQSDSRYPFADRAALVSQERKLEISRDTFIDAAIYVIGGDARAYISSIVVTPSLITFYIGDTGNKKIASATFNPFAVPADGALELIDSYGRPAGMLLSTALALAAFSAWPNETHTFKLADTEFVAGVVIPANEPGVRAVTGADGELLTGDVWLVGDRGVVLRAADEHTVRVDVVGEPLFHRVVCEPVARFQPKTFVQTITVNGVTCGPDEYGNFALTATGHAASDTILRIYFQDGTIKIDTVGKKVV